MMKEGGAVVYASLADMKSWARSIMDRQPDFIIGDNYLRRWWIIPRNEGCNVYLHEILHSDDDRAMHDHPWSSTSMLIDGSYIEHTPDGSYVRSAGDVVKRKATDLHRLEIPNGGYAISLFMTGRKEREWGFDCPQGWRHWTDFVDSRDSGKVGRGCGE